MQQFIIQQKIVKKNMFKIKSMKKIITLNNRADRLGTNYFSHLSTLVLGSINGAKVYRDHSLKYRKLLIYYPIIKYSKLRILPFPKDNLHTFTGLRGRIATPVMQAEQDLITLFNTLFKKNFIKSISDKKNNFFNISRKLICIHIRNDDALNIQDYDGTATHDYIKELVESKKFNLYDRKHLLKIGKDHQAPIEKQKLDTMIKNLRLEYGTEYEIKIVTSGSLSDDIMSVINKYNIEVQSQGEIIDDLETMINSQVLVLSKSFFSLIAGFLHQGSRVYYPKWGSFASLGLGSRFDDSGWIPYV